MTLEDTIQSKRQELWTRMYNLLDLNPASPARGGRGRVSMIVQPTVSSEQLLTTGHIRTVSALAIVGLTTYLNVPDDEYWTLIGYQADRSAGDRDITDLQIRGPDLGSLQSMIVDVFAAASSRRFMFPVPIPLYAGWEIRLNASGGTTDGNYQLTAMFERRSGWLQ